MLQKTLRLLAVLFTFLLPFSSGAVRLYIDVTSGTIQPYTFEVNEKNAPLAQKVLEKDLTLTPYFRKGSPPEIRIKINREKHIINFEAYAGDTLLTTSSYRTSDERGAAHTFANALIEVLTGKPGPFGRRIVYIQGEHGRDDVYSSDIDGSGVRKITNISSLITSKRISPDGTKLLLSTYFVGNPDVVIVNLLTGEQKFLQHSKRPEFSPAWFPDSRRYLFSKSTGGNTDIFIASLDSSASSPLIYGWGIQVSPDVSPDGRYVVYTDDSSGSPQIYVYDVKEKVKTRITFIGKYNASPRFSPDGSKIAFVNMRKDRWFDIAVINADGTDFQIITDGTGSNECPAWSPDGRFIIFSAKRNSEDYDIYMVSVETGKISLLFKKPGDQKCPEWMPRVRGGVR